MKSGTWARAGAVAVVAAAVVLSGQWGAASGSASSAGIADQPEDRATVIINITQGPEELFNLMSAYRMADGAINVNKRVVLYFSKGGVHVPTRHFPTELRVGDDHPVWDILRELRRRGAEIVVCGESAESLGIHDGEFIAEAKIANTTEAIFSRVNNNTVVFTY